MQIGGERKIQVKGSDNTKTERWEGDCHAQGVEKNLEWLSENNEEDEQSEWSWRRRQVPQNEVFEKLKLKPELL